MNDIKLLFFGDFFLKTKRNKLFSSDLCNEMKEYDIISCNFEGPVCDENWEKIAKAGSYLCQNKDNIRYLVENNIRLLSVANNHIADYKEKGINNTIVEIKINDAYSVGADIQAKNAYKPTIIKAKGKKVGFLSFCEAEFGRCKLSDTGGGFAWINDLAVDGIIKKLSKTVDYLIIQVHAGVEEIDLPLPEWRERYKKLIDSGADMVIGHHPHVPQGWELYKNKYIFYSLGNFVFEGNNGQIDTNGIAVLVTLKDKKQVLVKTKKICYFNDQVVLIIDKEKYLEQLHSNLLDKKYEENINKIVVDLWNKIYHRYYVNAVGGREGIFREIVKRIRGVIRYTNPNYILLLHNIRIESHRWVVERALSILNKNENTYN